VRGRAAGGVRVWKGGAVAGRAEDERIAERGIAFFDAS